MKDQAPESSASQLQNGVSTSSVPPFIVDLRVVKKKDIFVNHHILSLLRLTVQLKPRPGQATDGKKLGGQVGVGVGLLQEVGQKVEPDGAVVVPTGHQSEVHGPTNVDVVLHGVPPGELGQYLDPA